MVRTYGQDGYHFEWSGGQYIDVHSGDDPVPFTCINVKRMDGSMAIERSMRGFRRRCARWIRTSA